MNFGRRVALLKDASGALLLSSCWNSCVPIYDKNLRTHRLHFAEKVEFENWAQVYHGQVMSPHHSDQMSLEALCSVVKTLIVSGNRQTNQGTMSPIELWTAKMYR